MYGNKSLFTGLKRNQHSILNNYPFIVIAGLTDETHWKTRMIGLTKPYRIEGKEKHVIAVQEGENAFLIQLEFFLRLKKPSK
jgi:hypothetical protein